MMRILFLDFDGVILTMRTCIADGLGHSGSKPDPVACSAIRRACEGGVKIVVSSTWRKFTRCHAKLGQAGLEDFLHDDWRTDHTHDDRPKAIADWLAAHPEVTDYRILDDDHFLWTAEQAKRWLRCCAYNGLQWLEMEELMKWAGVTRAQLRVEAAGQAGKPNDRCQAGTPNLLG